MSAPVARFGERALRFVVPSDAGRRTLLDALRGVPHVLDVVLAEDLGAVILDSAVSASVLERVEAVLSAHARVPAPVPSLLPPHLIRVAYDGDDLMFLAARLGITADELIALHTAAEYEVAMVGFMPGFAYLRGLDPRLVVERRDAPRARVPARSVAIAAGYTGIYPFASPGGWHLLGEAIDFTPFDGQGAALSVGTRVRFERATRQPSASSPRATPIAVTAPAVCTLPGAQHLEVRKVQGLALLVDRGRFGRMHEGVPHGGALVQRRLAAANARAGNDAGACAIEVYGSLELVARGGTMLVANDAGEPTTLHDGEAFAVRGDRTLRARYVAVAGGIDVPVVLGGKGTMLAAGIGGFAGRGLRRGDSVPVGRETSQTGAGGSTGMADTRGAARDVRSSATQPAGVPTTILVEPGPDVAGAELWDETFQISTTSDRTGTRLEGPRIDSVQHARDRPSMPMVLGAIQRAPSGLIVLGPDHPTTGGYPVVGVVTSTSLDDLFELPAGRGVRFAPAS